MKKPTVMIIDDERNFAESLRLAIEDALDVSTCETLGQARTALAETLPDAVLLDVQLPDGNGTELLRDLKESGDLPVVIVMTAYATVENAISALKLGAVDYFTKPLDIEKLKRELAVYLENRTLQKKVHSLDREIKRIVPPFVTTGRGAMQKIVEQAPLVAHLPIPILIQGETGTGKEKLAQWIHDLSGLQGAMVTLSCAAVPKDIFESELFGYVKGAFSGATGTKEGFIELAEGGTLFLDEIGELSDETQAKLLRVLESGHYFKLGDTRERKASFRLITATHKNLGDTAAGFRQDLYFRINGISLALPRLGDRIEDIPLLATAFVQEANHAYSRDVKGISDEAVAALKRHDWPGNIRELKWCIHRAVATAQKGVLGREDLALGTSAPKKREACSEGLGPGSLDTAVAETERRLIKNALASAGDNRTEAARMLGISVRQLHYKLKRYSL